jgi:hypothetical protein
MGSSYSEIIMTDFEILQNHLRGELRAKQHLLTVSTLDGNTAAANRAQKSIVLRTTKLLCEHSIRVGVMSQYGKAIRVIRCDRCRTTAVAPP